MSGTACRVCGCTYERACNPPCAWFDPTLCTLCALAAEAVREWARASVEPSLSALLREAGMDPRLIDTSDAELVATIDAMLNERAAFIAGHADRIAVRARVEGRLQTLWLSELPPDVLLCEGFRLLLQAHAPLIAQPVEATKAPV
jgi:hypothetical protein